MSARRLLGNAVSMLASDITTRATTFVLYALVTRHLGLFQFGQFTLAVTYFSVFQVLSVAGLKTLITREVAKDRTKTGAYLVSGSVIVTAMSLLSVLSAMGLVQAMGYARDTALVILLLMLGLLPFSLAAVCEGLFRAWEQMRYIAFANVPLNTLKIGAAFLLLGSGYGLYPLVLLLLVFYWLVVLVEWAILLRRAGRPALLPGLRLAPATVRATAPFLGIEGLFAITASLNVLILSRLAGERDVGLYNAASQLLVPVFILYQNAAVTVFPLMARTYQSGLGDLKRISERLVELLLVVGLPTVVGLFFLADSVLVLLYGDEDFARSSIVLRILVWDLLLRAMTISLGQVLLAGLRERVTLRIMLVDLLVGLVAGVALVSQFGLIGAALAAVTLRLTDFLQHYVRVSRLVGRVALFQATWKPAVATACMAVYLVAIGRQPLVLTVLTAGALYAVVLLGLTIAALGGLRQAKVRYLYLWSE